MTQILKLKDAGSRWRQLLNGLRQRSEKAIIEDEENRPVAIVVPVELYRRYEAEREADFAVFHEVKEALKDYDPEELQARIDQAVEEVKAKSRPQRTVT
jgi:hypothetical protein